MWGSPSGLQPGFCPAPGSRLERRLQGRSPAPLQMTTIQEAADRIRMGDVVAFPTETVYGLGANALEAAAVPRRHPLKGRPAPPPLILPVSSAATAKCLARPHPP